MLASAPPERKTTMLTKHAEKYGRIAKAQAIARQIIVQADKLLELNDISDNQFEEFKELTRSFMGPMALEYEPIHSKNQMPSPSSKPQEPNTHPKHRNPPSSQTDTPSTGQSLEPHSSPDQEN